MNETIAIRDLTMRFGEAVALDGVTAEFGGKRIYGLLGRNGAGKTTLLNLISNRLIPTAGAITIDGEPAMENDRAQGRVYYMGEKTHMPDSINVRTLFRYTRDFYPGFDMEYAGYLADKFELNVKKKLKSLSTGYLTIAKLIAALSTDAPYLLLDEPVLGLDANHRELFYRELIDNYSTRPRTIVISTHLIEEVADLIEEVVILKQGKLLLEKPMEEVRRMGYSVAGKASEVDAFCAGRQVLSVDELGGLKTACVLGEPKNVPDSLEVSVLDLQKLFVQLTNA